MRVRLVARGFEEDHEIQKDSPTVSKAALRPFLAIAASTLGTVKTTDIKSAFLQGKALDREVFLQLPKEATTPASKIWRLPHASIE